VSTNIKKNENVLKVYNPFVFAEVANIKEFINFNTLLRGGTF
jgi:hypothetical protein